MSSKMPPLPEPAGTAYVQGPAMQGGEYRLLVDSYEPDCAMFSPAQMLAYGRECLELAARECEAWGDDLCIECARAIRAIAKGAV